MISSADFDRAWSLHATYQGPAAGSIQDTDHGEILIWSWITGGESGGSCWSNDRDTIDAQTEPADLLLEVLILHMLPEISLRAWKTILAQCPVQRKTEREYYGNYTQYDVRKISKKQLQALLEDLGLLKDPTGPV